MLPGGVLLLSDQAKLDFESSLLSEDVDDPDSCTKEDGGLDSEPDLCSMYLSYQVILQIDLILPQSLRILSMELLEAQ
jgi:hypothetical protein